MHKMLSRLQLSLIAALLIAACGEDTTDNGDKRPGAAEPAPPSLTNLPAEASGHTGEAGSFQVTATDPNEGDALTLTIDASGCGFEVTASAARLLSWTCPAAVTTCEVTVTVTDAGGLTDSDKLSILCENAAPSVADVAISPDPIVNVGDPLTCGYTFMDADGDADASTIEWLIAGQVVAAGATFAAYQPRDVISCRVTPNDGALAGSPVTSAEVTAPDRVALAAGRHHACATAAGVVHCWGNGANGQLGRFVGANSSQPPGPIEGAEVAGALSAGGAHTCAIIGGGLKCWGYNAYGELGIGGTNEVSEPRQVVGLTAGVTAVSIGERHACAVVSGALRCWGDNNARQLGDDTTTQRNTPVAVPSLAADVSAVATGGAHTCAIQGGALKCWGANGVGQLGVEVPDGSTGAPTQVAGLTSGVSAVSAAISTTCAIQGGALKCWGRNEDGQLGDGTRLNRGAPTQVPGLDAGVTAVAVGEVHVCAIHSGALRCWGGNASGQLGDGTRDARLAPTAVTGLDSDVTAVAVGEAHTCAVQRGKVKCWGNNMYRQLGSARGASSSPVDVTLP